MRLTQAAALSGLFMATPSAEAGKPKGPVDVSVDCVQLDLRNTVPGCVSGTRPGRLEDGGCGPNQLTWKEWPNAALFNNLIRGQIRSAATDLPGRECTRRDLSTSLSDHGLNPEAYDKWAYVDVDHLGLTVNLAWNQFVQDWPGLEEGTLPSEFRATDCSAPIATVHLIDSDNRSQSRSVSVTLESLGGRCEGEVPTFDQNGLDQFVKEKVAPAIKQSVAEQVRTP